MTSPFDDDDATVIRDAPSEVSLPPARGRAAAPAPAPAPFRGPPAAPPARPRAPAARPPVAPMRPAVPSGYAPSPMWDTDAQAPPIRAHAASFPQASAGFGSPHDYGFEPLSPPAPWEPQAASYAPVQHAPPLHRPPLAPPAAQSRLPVAAALPPPAPAAPRPVVNTAIVGVVVATPSWAIFYLIFVLFIALVGVFLLTRQAALVGHF